MPLSSDNSAVIKLTIHTVSPLFLHTVQEPHFLMGEQIIVILESRFAPNDLAVPKINVKHSLE